MNKTQYEILRNQIRSDGTEAGKQFGESLSVDSVSPETLVVISQAATAHMRSGPIQLNQLVKTRNAAIRRLQIIIWVFAIFIEIFFVLLSLTVTSLNGKSIELSDLVLLGAGLLLSAYGLIKICSSESSKIEELRNLWRSSFEFAAATTFIDKASAKVSSQLATVVGMIEQASAILSDFDAANEFTTIEAAKPITSSETVTISKPVSSVEPATRKTAKSSKPRLSRDPKSRDPIQVDPTPIRNPKQISQNGHIREVANTKIYMGGPSGQDPMTYEQFQQWLSQAERRMKDY